jgi:hypothetical protein
MVTALRIGTAEHMTPTMPRSSDAHASPTNPGRGSITVAFGELEGNGAVGNVTLWAATLWVGSRSHKLIGHSSRGVVY